MEALHINTERTKSLASQTGLKHTHTLKNSGFDGPPAKLLLNTYKPCCDKALTLRLPDTSSAKKHGAKDDSHTVIQAGRCTELKQSYHRYQAFQTRLMLAKQLIDVAQSLMAPIAAEQALSECPNCAKSNAGDTAGKSAQGSPFGLEDIASHKAWRNILMMLSTAGGQGSQGHPVGAGGSSERQRQSGNENAADHETGSEDLPGDIQIKEEQGAPSNSFSRGGREVKKEPESPDIKPKVETAEGGTNLSQIAASEEGEGIASSTQIGDRNRNSGRQQMAPATLSSLRTSNIDLYAIPSAVPTPEPAAASPIPIVPEPSPEPQPQRQLRSTRRRRQQQSQRNLVPNPPRRRAQPSSSATSLRRSKRLRGEDAEMPEGLPAPLPRPKRRRVAR